MVIKDEQLKELRLSWQWQMAYEKAFKESKIDEIYEKLGELYGIDQFTAMGDSKRTKRNSKDGKSYGRNTDSKKATKKKI